MKKYMSIKSIWNLPSGLWLALILLLGITHTSFSATRTWTGGSALSSNWSYTSNWENNTPPANGDDIVFPAGAARLINTNTYNNRTFHSIRFTGTGYKITGKKISLVHGITAQTSAGSNTFELDIDLTASQMFICNESASKLYLNGNINLQTHTLSITGAGEKHLGGIISGSGGIRKIGSGPLWMDGSLANTYTGSTHVNDGILELNKTGGFDRAIPSGGHLFVGDNSGGEYSARVRERRDFQIATIPVTIYSDGLLDVGNFEDTVGAITFNGGVARSLSSGLLKLGGDVTVNANQGGGKLWGRVYLGSSTRTFTVEEAVNGFDLRIDAILSGDAALKKQGIGSLALYGANTYNGETLINEGHVYLKNSLGFGNITNGTTVNTNGLLYLSNNVHVGDEILTLNKPSGHAVEIAGNCSWAGNVVLSQIAQIWLSGDSAKMEFSGVISGSGGITKSGLGDLVLSGSARNTYTGATLVKAGNLLLNKISTIGNAVQYGSLTIGDGSGAAASATVKELSGYQIGNIDVTVNSDGYFNLNNFSDRIGKKLTLNNGGDVNSGSGVLTLSKGNQIKVRSVSGGDVSYIYGKINLGTTTSYFDVGRGSLYLYANIAGSANVQVATPSETSGNLFLYGVNTFSGSLTLRDHVYVVAGNSSALGSTNGNVMVENSSILRLSDGVNVNKNLLTMNSDAPLALRIGTGAAIWSGPIVLQRNTHIDSYSPNPSSITLSGSISGTGGLSIGRPGTDSDFKLVLSGAGNSYTGDTIVNRGVLELSNANVIRDGTLQIGDKDGEKESAIVRFAANFPIHSAANIVINSDGLLHANNHSDDLGAILLDRGQIKTGSGELTLYKDISVANTAGNPANWFPSIYGNIKLSGTRTITVSQNADLFIHAQISGNEIIKSGQGSLRFYGANTYTGKTRINEGRLLAKNNSAFGSISQGTIVANGANLYLLDCQVGNEALTLQDGSILSAAGSTNGWTGAITLNGASKFLVGAGSALLNLSGAIGGSGSVTIDRKPYSGTERTGTIIYSGSVTNSYTGDTTVKDGTLLFSKSVMNGCVQGHLIIGDNNGAPDSSVVRLLNNKAQIGNRSRITVHDDGLFDPLGIGEWFGSLEGTGHVTLGDAQITLLDDTSALFSGRIEGTGGLVKAGSGTFTLTGNNTYSGETEVNEGKIVINGQQSSSPVSVGWHGTLGGTGTVASIVCEGMVEPGSNVGTLISSGATSMKGSATFKVELSSKNNYDQLEVNGALKLDNPQLNLSWGFTPEKGDEFTLIHANFAEGTFNGLTNGATLSVNGVDTKINYNGGSGHDVILLVTGGDALTPLRILSINAEAGELVWDGPQTYSCIVEHKSSLTNASWTAVSTASTNRTVVINIDDDQGFFRVRKD